MKKLLFVFNPHSGTGKIGKYLAEILDVFAKAGYETLAYPTQSPSDGPEKIGRDGMSFDRIVAAGGDGMAHKLVNAMMSLPKQIPAGYIPVGTVNDFARSTKIPQDPVKAAEIAVSENIRALDVGKFNMKYFCYVAAFGFATDASYSTNQTAKNSFGKLAYLTDILKTLDLQHFEAACRGMTIKTETEEISGNFIFGAVSNSNSIAGMNNLVSRDVELDDGILEGLFIRCPNTLLELEQLKNGLLTRNFNAPCLCPIKSDKFEIRCELTPWTLDGENGGEHENVIISVKNKALKIALPEN